MNKQNEKLIGGKSAGMSLEDIAKKHNVDIEVLKKQFEKGIKVESEHTKEKEIAEEIAKDHLFEMADYYDKLEKMEKKNAKQMPEIFYCRHIEQGVAKYSSEMLLIQNECLKKMAKTMLGKPVVVIHQDINEEFIDKLQERSDGYVVENFYNELDGWWWAKMIIVSDDGHDAIAKKWSVSNAYKPLESTVAGEWHSVFYDREIKDAEYTHLAIVPNPRYENALILDCEQYKKYNEQKKRELEELKNSKENKKEGGRMLKFFTREKKEVKTSEEIQNSFVEIDGKEVAVQDLISNAIKKNAEDEEAKKKAELAEKEKMNMDSEVDVGDKKMKLKDLVESYKASKKNSEDEEKAKKEEEEKNKKNAEDEETKKKEEEEEKNKKNAKEKELQNAKEELENAQKKVNEILNAHLQEIDEVQVIETSSDQLERGKQRYGSI